MKIVYISFFTAFIVVLGYVPPITLAFIPVPIVLQNLGPLLAGSVLGIYGAASTLLLLLLVAIGLPVLTGGRGGIAVFFGPTGGYLIGFVVAAFVVGLFTQKNWQYYTFFRGFVFNIIGVIMIYVCGIPILMLVTKIDLSKAIISNLVFIPLDVLKAAFSATIAVQFKKYYPLIKRKYE